MVYTFLSKKAGTLLTICFFFSYLAFGQVSRSVACQTSEVAQSETGQSSPALRAQQPDPAATETITASMVKLFVHTDKNIYQQGEYVWFTAYVLNRDADVMQKQNTLFVLLVDAVTHTTAVQQRFLIQNGIGKGSILLPDSIRSGDYWLIGYTNALLNGSRQPIFRELISVRDLAPPPFRVTNCTIESSSEAKDSIAVRYKIGTSSGGLASGGKFAYTVFAGPDSLTSGQKLIDPFGEVLVSIPRNKATENKLEIIATVTRDGLSKSFILPVYQGIYPKPAQDPTPTKADLPGIKVAITTDSAEYHSRALVTLHIHITDSAGRPLPALFSFSVAYARKMDTTRQANITTFTPSLNSALSDLTAQGFGADAPDYGYVLYNGKSPKTPVSLALMGGKFLTFQTDSFGHFELPYPFLIAQPGESDYLSVLTDKAQEKYKLVLRSKDDAIDSGLALQHYPLNFYRPVFSQDSDELQSLKTPELLKAAIVTKVSAGKTNMFSGQYESHSCDQDYVCTHDHGPSPFNHVLNCPDVVRHPCPTTKPVEGQSYVYMGRDPRFKQAAVAGLWVYHCAAPTIPSFMTPLKPIQRPQTFPTQDLSTGDELFVGALYRTTIYWKHLLSTDKNGDAVISFHTNDLSGKFICILQGISSEGALCGKGSYVVDPGND
jgi:hypothetical protein